VTIPLAVRPFLPACLLEIKLIPRMLFPVHLVTMAVNRPTLTKKDGKGFFRVTDAELRTLPLVTNDPKMPYEGRRSELPKTGGYWYVLAPLARDKVEILTHSARPDPRSYSLSPSRGAGTPQPPGT
jgi:hypothetical protein